MRKRKPPIAKSLVKNSISAMFSAIEIHNKPTIRYRYEIVVLLILNSWELLLKGYLYKYHKDIKLFNKDGTTKPFENCLNIVNAKIGKDFNPISENLKVLYDYRNQIAHFYIKELDFIIYSLIAKSIIFYSHFILKYFNINLSATSDLVLLPIGFKRPISPIDYISNTSINQNASKETKDFIKRLINSSRRLNDSNIDETIFVNFKMNLINVNRITNADIIAGVDNTIENELIFTVQKSTKTIKSSTTGQNVVLTRDKSKSSGTLYYETLSEGIFDEINNILDANDLLAKGNHKFMLGTSLYYRIYAERQFVSYNISRFELLAKTGMINFYAPFMFWLAKLPENNIAKILYECFNNAKSPKINNLIKISILLGEEVSEFFIKLFEQRYKNIVQKPDHYYTFKKMIKSKKKEPILKALNVSKNKKIEILNKNYSIGELLDDKNLSSNLLSNMCLSVFNGEVRYRRPSRDVDYVVNNNALIEKQKKIIEELKKYEG